ncbi:sugar ABC transporter ATP-binding protein [Subtercola sp. PAMC28395]|uniref:sugar ABC transporter ATP-binding protein n=1 Tax=Subtercola sp. PAMC28395 TaxID=2846775 RepID=UPI001C0B22A4|nr:sugar ABC transporter ATP-binding protein [Subtercola sp. PAMC28395]QWT25129.1 sugar ABC transporter ATP-binding protein [Subtercola sp. PAMC28395]
MTDQIVTPRTMTAEPLLEVSHLTKAYPGVKALTDVSFVTHAGEVHGLVGENGAGKSTLLKIIAGATRQDAGAVTICGTDIVGGDPHQASAAGSATIYQELTIVPDLSAVSNVFLGHLPHRFGVVDGRRARRTFAEVAQTVGLTAPAAARAGGLSTAAQQLLEIMRALVLGKRLVIMDEPTASLGPEDSQKLHTVIRNLRDTGHAIVYVSHDLDAVLEICDTVTVLREGVVVDSRPVAEWEKSSLIRGMLGGAALERVAPGHSTPPTGTALVQFSGLRAPGVHLDRLDLHAGEIVGLAGLVGSGRTRLLRSLAGAEHVDAGSVAVNGSARRWPGSPRKALSLGIALAPEDRKHQGLLLGQPAAWNVALGRFAVAAGRRAVRATRLSRWAAPASARVGFAPERLGALAGELSGGNQQKLVLARWLSRPIVCLLLDEPTRGIDIGAKAQIFETAREIVNEGRAVLWSSSDLEEVVQHSDRILVVAGGRVVAELPGGSTVHDVLEISYAHSTQPKGEV